jgi:protein-tyrosine phosphatase
MAEAALIQILSSNEINLNTWNVRSAGLDAMQGLPALQMAQNACLKAGLDLGNHRSRALSQKMIELFHLILAMEKWQKDQIQQQFPDQSINIYLLSEMMNVKKDILDPFGKTLDFYMQTLLEIQQYLNQGLKRILLLARI